MPTIPLAVRTDAVSKIFGRFAALRKVTASFNSGECYIVVGPNGAGKSTLLRVIAGLIHPTLGTIEILGSADPGFVRGKIGYLSHASMLYDEMTARENLRYTASLYTGENLLTPEQALALVGMDPALQRPVGQFSQGMRQRTALARVLLPQPELLLLDEPFSNVDAASGEQMVRALQELRAAGRTILLTTHQPEIARPLADWFCTMENGQIVRVQPSIQTNGTKAAGTPA